MCVALPGEVIWIGPAACRSRPARIRVGSEEYEVDLMMVPEAGVGDHVVAHSGFAIRLVPSDPVSGMVSAATPERIDGHEETIGPWPGHGPPE